MISESQKKYIEKRIRSARLLFPMPGSGTDTEIDEVCFKQAEVISPGAMIKIRQLSEDGLSPDAIADLDIAAGTPDALVEIWRRAARHIASTSNGSWQVAPTQHD